MPHTSQISPCYSYRYQRQEESDVNYAERCAAELEQEILRVGKSRAAAFFAETSEFLVVAVVVATWAIFYAD
jgi:adenosylmethionine-8-amino-7-oxononanoate aminotransferase